MRKLPYIWQTVKEHAGHNFKFATIHFILIMLFITMMQKAFGAENSVIAVIFAPLILIMVPHDLTARPFKHMLSHAAFICTMALCASITSVVPMPAALMIHVLMIFSILYLYTYECGEHLYFQYALGYLFLIFLSPVTPEQLPKRLAAIVVASACLILYQLVKGKNRTAKSIQEILINLIKEADKCIDSLLKGEKPSKNMRYVCFTLGKLSRSIDYRRKKTLCISDAGLTAIETGQNLESLIVTLYEAEPPSDSQHIAMLSQMRTLLSLFHTSILQRQTQMPSAEDIVFDSRVGEIPEKEHFSLLLSNIHRLLSKMQESEKLQNFTKTTLSLRLRLKAMINFSPVRLIYALRVSCILAIGILFVQSFDLPHGKWLLFTIASVSLPYAEEVGIKAKKRLLATLIGCLAAVVIFSSIPSPIIRNIIVLSTGYLSFYMPGYLGMFSFATVGALGSAMMMNTVSFGAVGTIVFIRLFYIVLGLLIAIICNCVIFPFRLKDATRQLGKKYLSLTESLANIRRKGLTDPQLYYNTVLYLHLLEVRLFQNAEVLHWDGIDDLLDRRLKILRE